MTSKAKPQENQQTPVGHILKAARESKQITLESVCSYLKLTKNQIHTLEEDKYPNKELSIFHRGYLKKYCQLLDIDMNELTKALSLAGFITKNPDFYYQSNSVMHIKPNKKINKKTKRSTKIAIMTILVAITSLLYLQNMLKAGSNTQNSNLLPSQFSLSTTSSLTTTQTTPKHDKPNTTKSPHSLKDMIDHKLVINQDTKNHTVHLTRHTPIHMDDAP